MCIYAHKYTHLNIDPEEVEIFCDVLFEVPRMAEDKVEKKHCAWSRLLWQLLLRLLVFFMVLTIVSCSSLAHTN